MSVVYFSIIPTFEPSRYCKCWIVCFYYIIIQLAREGKVIIFVSSELPELIGMCDRIIVMHEGKISGEVTGGEMNQKSIMYLATVEGGIANGAD